MIALANEEDVKIKIIVPYLQSLGFDISELYYEKSFHLKVGRFAIRIDTEAQISSAQPRLDILVTRGGQNLFIVEVKGPEISIDSDDIDQAVCYARLVHPIAPLCLITNGKVWKLVDTITKEELTTNKIDPHSPLTASLPEEAYYQAIRYFLGYSHENILVFCQKQVSKYMEQLRGATNDRDKKYISELYEERKHLAAKTNVFLQSEARCFGVIGDSGSGKTCWACYGALHSARQSVVTFFYRGADVTSGILEAISSDLNWALSPQHNDIQAVKRLLELFEHEPIVVWVDDIDGLPVDMSRRILTEFFRRTEGYPVKLLLTCKSETWQYLLEEDGIPTSLASLVFQVDDVRGYKIEALDEQELLGAIAKYRAFYRYSGRLDFEVLEVCRKVPFLMRVLFEVAANLSLPHIGYTVVDFFEVYFQQLCKRFGEEQDAIRRLLPTIARRFYELNSEEVELDDLLEYLGISLLQSLPERLFTLNILERTYRQQTTYIGFYFKKLRDYLIAFRALKWSRKSTQDFHQLCAKLDRHGVHLDTLNLYYSLTSLQEHKRVLDGELYTNVSAFLALYEGILDAHFSTFKSSFPPNTTGSIGFVGHVDFSRNAISIHGFYPLEDGNVKILLIPMDSMMKGNKGYLVGSRRMHLTGSFRDYQSIDIAREVLLQNVEPFLKDIVKKGKLDESQNRAMLIERVMATCLQNYIADIRKLQGTSQVLFPIRLEEVKTVLLYRIAYDLLWHQLMDRRIAAGTVEERRDGPYVTHIIPMISEEQVEVEKQAWILAREGKNVSSERNYQKTEDSEVLLLEDIAYLEKLGVSEIGCSSLIKWYEGGNQRRRMLTFGTAYNEQFKGLLEDLFLTFLNEYRILVERNFPVLCQNFKLYQIMPLTMHWNLEEVQETHEVSLHILYLQKMEKKSESMNTVVYCTNRKIEQIEQEWRENPTSRKALHVSCDLHFSFLFGNSYTPFRVSNSNPYILRKLVYEQIEEDLKEVISSLSSKYLI